MNTFRLQDPWWLLALAILGVLTLMRRRRAAVLFSDVGLVAALPRTFAQRLRPAVPWVRLVGLAMIVVALARPQFGQEEFRIRTEGIAIQMCIDRSGSMRALDFYADGKQISRLEAVRRVFRDFITGKGGLKGRPDDQIGLIAFGGFPEAMCPLTLDHGALLEVLDTVRVADQMTDARGMPVHERLLQEETATAIGDTIVQAVERLREVQAKSKIIILLSDGKQTAGAIEPADAAEVAKTFGIKVYTIGVGSNESMTPMPVSDMFGRTVIQMQSAEIDEEALKMLASTTGGQYFAAQDSQSLANVYAQIDQLEKSPSEGRLYSEYRELYQYLLFPGLGLVLLELVLASTRFRSLP